MVSWHDDRNGNYEVFMARSIDGYKCDQDNCERKMLSAFEDEITECTISLTYSPAIAGVYNFALEFYQDAGLEDLYTTINIGDAPERWYINGASVENSLTYDADGDVLGYQIVTTSDITVAYIPDRNDGIFDMVLYTKLTASVT